MEKKANKKGNKGNKKKKKNTREYIYAVRLSVPLLASQVIHSIAH